MLHGRRESGRPGLGLPRSALGPQGLRVPTPRQISTRGRRVCQLDGKQPPDRPNKGSGGAQRGLPAAQGQSPLPALRLRLRRARKHSSRRERTSVRAGGFHPGLPLVLLEPYPSTHGRVAETRRREAHLLGLPRSALPLPPNQGLGSPSEALKARRQDESPGFHGGPASYRRNSAAATGQSGRNWAKCKDERLSAQRTVGATP